MLWLGTQTQHYTGRKMTLGTALIFLLVTDIAKVTLPVLKPFLIFCFKGMCQGTNGLQDLFPRDDLLKENLFEDPEELEW